MAYDWIGAGVGAGQVQQVVDEALEPDHLFQHAAVGGARIGSVRVGEVDLDLGAHAGEGAAQLV